MGEVTLELPVLDDPRTLRYGIGENLYGHAEISGFAGRAPYLAGYEAAGGTVDEERFEWWKVEGTLRWAVGLAAQTMAFLDGRVPSIVMAASGRRVPELEWDLLMLIRPAR